MKKTNANVKTTTEKVMPKRVLELQEKLKKYIDADKRVHFYMEGYEYIIRATLTRMIRYYGYDVNIRYDEDLRQEMATLLYDYVINFEPIRQEMPAKKVEKKLNNKTGQFYEEIVDYVEVSYLDFKDLDLKTLTNILIMRLRNGVRPYFAALKSINSEIAISAIIDVDSWGGDFADGEITLIDRIHDKAAELKIDAVGLIESLQGTLSKGEYSFLMKWLENGRQPYKDGKVTKRIREKLKKQGLTDTLIIAEAIREELYRLQVKEHKLSEKLYKLAGV